MNNPYVESRQAEEWSRIMTLSSLVVGLDLRTTVRAILLCSTHGIHKITFLIPTDITYSSLAKSFNQNLVHDAETLKRMEAMSKTRKWNAQQNAEQRTAYQRMALFPEKAEVIFVGTDIWVVSTFIPTTSPTADAQEACRAIGGEIMHFPWNPIFVSKDAHKSYPVLASTSRERTAHENTSIHRVSCSLNASRKKH